MRRGWKISIAVVAVLVVLIGVNAVVYSSYTGSHEAFDDYTAEKPLPERAAATGKPQIANDPRAAFVLTFDRPVRHELQKRLQKPEAVRKRP